MASVPFYIYRYRGPNQNHFVRFWKKIENPKSIELLLRDFIRQAAL